MYYCVYLLMPKQYPDRYICYAINLKQNCGKCYKFTNDKSNSELIDCGNPYGDNGGENHKENHKWRNYSV